MATISEIAKRLNDYVSNLDANINEAVVFVEDQILDLNREQMKKRQVDSRDMPITPEYSPGWKIIKNLRNPNLFDTGNFQNSLIINVAYPKYLIKSTDWKNEKLTSKYGDQIFGIAPSNRIKAYAITGKAIAKHLKNRVFK